MRSEQTGGQSKQSIHMALIMQDLSFFEKSKRNISYEKAEMLLKELEKKSEYPVCCGVCQPIKG